MIASLAFWSYDREKRSKTRYLKIKAPSTLTARSLINNQMLISKVARRKGLELTEKANITAFLPRYSTSTACTKVVPASAWVRLVLSKIGKLPKWWTTLLLFAWEGNMSPGIWGERFCHSEAPTWYKLLGDSMLLHDWWSSKLWVEEVDGGDGEVKIGPATIEADGARPGLEEVAWDGAKESGTGNKSTVQIRPRTWMSLWQKTQGQSVKFG